jgi:hypothetical protein
MLLYTYDEFEESARKKSGMQYKIKNERVILGWLILMKLKYG